MAIYCLIAGTFNKAKNQSVAAKVNYIARAGKYCNPIGTSGTIRAIRSVVRAEGWGNGETTTAALARLRAALIDAGRIGKPTLGGLSP